MGVRYEPLSNAELERIDGATMRVLRETGVKVLESEAVSLLEKAGAKFDKKTRIAKIPESLIRDCLKGAPRRFRLCGREGKHDLLFGEGNVYTGTVGTPVMTEGLDGVVRPSTVNDVENFYKLADALPNIDHSGWACWPRDVPERLAHLYEIYLGFRHSTKTLDGWNWGREMTEESIDLAAIVAGGREELKEKPMLLGFANPVSPLTLSKEATEGLISYAKAGQPCVYPPECLAGGTSPATVAGLLVQQNAEVLVSIAVAQLAERGAPSIYSSVSGMMDMRTGSIALGAPEVGLIMAGAAQLARFYGIPSRGTGGNTESMSVDYQAGVESMGTLLMAALSGWDIVYDAAGSIESSLTASYAKMVLDNDVCGEVKRIISGIDLSEESLAVDVIGVAAAKGGFLSSPHTLRHFRTETYSPSSFWRGSRTLWESQGRRDVITKAREAAEQIIREHRISAPLDREVDRRMTDYIKKVKKRKGV